MHFCTILTEFLARCIAFFLEINDETVFLEINLNSTLVFINDIFCDINFNKRLWSAVDTKNYQRTVSNYLTAA